MLTLYVIDPQKCFPDIALVLKSLKLIDQPWQDNTYLAGSKLMQHISFVGCMPFLNIKPNEHAEFCYIDIPCPSQTAQFMYAKNTDIPKCPECSNLKLTPATKKDGLCCAHCGTSFKPQSLKWRPRTSFYARQWFSIHQIQKGDAAPTGNFLTSLHKQTALTWDYCFL